MPDVRIDTTFDLGQTVYGIASWQAPVWVPCEFCGGEGVIVGANAKSRPCPECFGKFGKQEWPPAAWRVWGEFTVGQVRVEVTRSRGLDDEELLENFMPQEGRKETYMLVETGVGTGTLHDAANLFEFRASAEEACEQRNAAIGAPS